jgi:hypothetical protein
MRHGQQLKAFLASCTKVSALDLMLSAGSQSAVISALLLQQIMMRQTIMLQQISTMLTS